MHFGKSEIFELDGDPCPTPVGQPCLRCHEPIGPNEYGYITAHSDGSLKPQHFECFMRAIVGSLGHQQGKCFCFGGTEEDPPEMTEREAARAALAYYVVHMGQVIS
jgi:hypothetical protein